MKRSQRARPPGPPPGSPEPKAPWPVERHTGEGSASALEILQRLERSRMLPRAPAEAPGDAEAPPTPADGDRPRS